MKTNKPIVITRYIPREVYVVEDDCGQTYTAHTNKGESLYAGELIAEFDTEKDYHLATYTLN